MRIRSITSFDTEKQQIRVHFNKDSLQPVAPDDDEVVTRSRMREFKLRRQQFHHKTDNPTARIKKGFQFVVKTERFSEPTIVSDAIGDKHYFFPDLRQGKIYHFCVNEQSLAQLQKGKELAFESMRKHYDPAKKQSQSRQFNIRLKIYERLKHDIKQREKREKGLELDFAHALYMPIKGFVNGDVDWQISKLISTLDNMLKFHDEYQPPTEEEIQRSLEQLEERFAQQEEVHQLKKLQRQRNDLFEQIEGMVRSHENTKNQEKFQALVDEFNAVVAELENKENPAPQQLPPAVSVPPPKGKEEQHPLDNSSSSEEIPAGFFDAEEEEPEFARLQIRLDELNDHIELQELLGYDTSKKEEYEALIAERNQIMPKIALARERMLEEADAEEQRLEEEAAAEKQRLLMENIEEQLAQGPDIQELVEKTAALDTQPVVNNLFGNHHNFFKRPELTLWQRFCNFFRRLFCCTRPQVDEDEVQYQRLGV